MILRRIFTIQEEIRILFGMQVQEMASGEKRLVGAVKEKLDLFIQVGRCLRKRG